MSPDLFQRKDTVEVIISSSRQRLISVTSQWLSILINSVMGTVNNCYILEFDSSTQELISFAKFLSPTEIDLES